MKKLLVAVASLAFMGNAYAIDFTRPLTQLDGQPITGSDGKPLEKPPTLGSICEGALLAQYADERDAASGKETITPEDKFARWKLANKVNGGKDVNLTAEELSLIKKLIGKGYAPLIVGQVWMMLDPAMK
jgi:hypothetical protein